MWRVFFIQTIMPQTYGMTGQHDHLIGTGSATAKPIPCVL